MPLSTLRLKPRGVNRKTQGQDGVRFLLSCKALSSSTTCRFIPAHHQTGFAPATGWLTTLSNWRRVQRFRSSVFPGSGGANRAYRAAVSPKLWTRCARHEGRKPGDDTGILIQRFVRGDRIARADHRRSGVRQAMAASPLARSCPFQSLAPVLSIMRLVAAASKEAA
jgi:hypothetical protein